VLNPQIELLKIYFENNLRIKQAIQPYSAETIFELLRGLDPDWWNGDYLMNSSLQTTINKFFQKYTFQNFSGYYNSIFNFFKLSSKKLKANILFYSLDAYVHQQTEFNHADSIFIDSLVQEKLIGASLMQKIVPQLAPEVALSNEYVSLLTLFDSAGKEISLSKIFADKSKSYFVDFWAGWCRPCIDHLPESIRLGTAGYPSLEVLFFSMDRTQITYRESVQKNKVPLSHCFRFNQEEANMLRLQQIKPDPSIPAYRLFYYTNGKWHCKALSGAEDPSLRQFSLKIP
jgi:thiol-disulfide isomerase/thioredoxin